MVLYWLLTLQINKDVDPTYNNSKTPTPDFKPLPAIHPPFSCFLIISCNQSPTSPFFTDIASPKNK